MNSFPMVARYRAFGPTDFASLVCHKRCFFLQTIKIPPEGVAKQRLLPRSGRVLSGGLSGLQGGCLRGGPLTPGPP